MVFGGTSRITICVQPVFCRVHVSQDRSKCDPTFLRDKTGSGVRILKKKKSSPPVGYFLQQDFVSSRFQNLNKKHDY